MTRSRMLVTYASEFAAHVQVGLQLALLGCDDEVGLDSLPDDLLVQVMDGQLGLVEARGLMFARISEHLVPGDVVTHDTARILGGTSEGSKE